VPDLFRFTAHGFLLTVFLLSPLFANAAVPKRHAAASSDSHAASHTPPPPPAPAPVFDERTFTAAPPDFSHFQPILDRMPFGALPPNFGQAATAEQAKDAAQVQAEQQKLAQKVNMSCVNVTPDGATAIGFTDLDVKPPVNYYLLVGASAGGWTVVAADYDEEWAQIKKEDVTITLKLGKGLIDGPPTHDAAKTAVTAAQPTTPAVAPPVAQAEVGLIHRPSLSGLSSVPGLRSLKNPEPPNAGTGTASTRDPGGDIKSYMERLRERRQQETAEKAATDEAARKQLQELARKITQDELAKKEREENLKLIEQGAQPKSEIELTPEEEKALLDKGVRVQ